MLTLWQNSGWDKQNCINQIKYEAKGHISYPLKMRKTVGNDNRKPMRYIYNLQLWNLGLGGPLSWSSVQGIPGYGLRWYGLRLTTNSDFIVGGPLTQRSLLPKSSSPPSFDPLLLEFKCNCL